MSASSEFLKTASHVRNDCQSEFTSPYGGESASSPNKGNKKNSKKRVRANDNVEGKMVDMMSDFFNKTNLKLTQLVDKLGFDDTAVLRDRVFDALENIVGLDGEDKLKVTSAICDKKKDLELFLKVNDQSRRMMVKMILEGRY